MPAPTHPNNLQRRIHAGGGRVLEQRKSPPPSGTYGKFCKQPVQAAVLGFFRPLRWLNCPSHMVLVGPMGWAVGFEFPGIHSDQNSDYWASV